MSWPPGRPRGGKNQFGLWDKEEVKESLPAEETFKQSLGGRFSVWLPAARNRDTVKLPQGWKEAVCSPRSHLDGMGSAAGPSRAFSSSVCDVSPLWILAFFSSLYWELHGWPYRESDGIIKKKGGGALEEDALGKLVDFLIWENREHRKHTSECFGEGQMR